jgi:hypothetical protein
MKLARVCAISLIGFIGGVLSTYVFLSDAHIASAEVHNSVRPSPKAPQAQTKNSDITQTKNPDIKRFDTLAPAPNDNTGEMLARRKAGYYVLDLEIGARRQQMADSAVERSRVVLQRRELDYNQVFAALGLDGKTAEQVKEHIGKIYQAQTEALEYLGQAAIAQEAYDKRLKSLLGENYQAYLSYEQGQPAREELGYIGAFAQKNGLSLAAEEIPHVEKLLRVTGAYSMSTKLSSLGPYQPLPPIAASREELLRVHQVQYSEYQAAIDQISKHPEMNALSPNTQQLLREYYNQELGKVRQKIEQNSSAEASALYIFEWQLSAMRASQRPNQQRIKKLESDIAALRAKLGKQ